LRFLLRLEGFVDLFTRPTWANVLLLLAGVILAPGRRTVAAAIRILGRDRDRNFCTFHRILNRAAWSSRATAGRLLLLLVNTFVPHGAPIVIGLDDTIERRWGAQISARGIYRDPVRSSKGHFVKASGLRWLSAMLSCGTLFCKTATALLRSSIARLAASSFRLICVYQVLELEGVPTPRPWGRKQNPHRAATRAAY
jgi:hypothetical protein